MSPLVARLLTVACVTAYVAASAAAVVGAPVALLVIAAGCACALTVIAIPQVLS